MSKKPIKRALISVSDKSGILELATFLNNQGVEILSTGGTAQLLAESGIGVVEVSQHTGFPEIMGGRVKTLHPKIHGGILARRGEDDHVLETHEIDEIDLVIVNLYPFQSTISKSDCTLEMAIENIDIGGPAMLRAAAKNHQHVVVVVDPEDYGSVMAKMTEDGCRVDLEYRFELAVKCFTHTANYDSVVSGYLQKQLDTSSDNNFPDQLKLNFHKKQEMRYGENPHQQAAFYSDGSAGDNVTNAVQHQGKELSYNNVADTDAAFECVKQFSDGQACVIVKHANPCGVAELGSQLEAYQSAFETDPESAFGGIIAFNNILQIATVEAILEKQFVEVIIAPGMEEGVLEVAASKPNVRLLTSNGIQQNLSHMELKRVMGGLLVQSLDADLYQELNVVTEVKPDEDTLKDLVFAWKVAKFVKSNAIVYAKGMRTIGVGAGQMSRVNSARIAAIKAEHAGLNVKGAVMASDAFFPFRDGLDNAAEVGIKAVIQPGGSMRDEEVVQAANEHNMAMIFTKMRHFRH